MITLNSDRGFVKVESWDEILELPGFTLDLNPKEHELKDIIGRYIFKTHIKCGLSSCHTAHGKGYIVSTKSGPITNIGHQCGKTHFKIEFEQLSRVFEKSIQEHIYRENIGNFLIFMDLHEQTIKDLRSGHNKADELHKKGQAIRRKGTGCPDEIISALLKLIKNRNGAIMSSREASKNEIEDLEAIGGKSLPRPYYIEEKIGELNGIEFFYEENDLRKLLVLDLEDGLKKIRELDIDKG
jgi:hypothetical protein